MVNKEDNLEKRALQLREELTELRIMRGGHLDDWHGERILNPRDSKPLFNWEDENDAELFSLYKTVCFFPSKISVGRALGGRSNSKSFPRDGLWHFTTIRFLYLLKGVVLRRRMSVWPYDKRSGHKCVAKHVEVLGPAIIPKAQDFAQQERSNDIINNCKDDFVSAMQGIEWKGFQKELKRGVKQN